MKLPEKTEGVIELPLEAAPAEDTCVSGPRWLVKQTRYGQAFKCTELPLGTVRQIIFALAGMLGMACSFNPSASNPSSKCTPQISRSWRSSLQAGLAAAAATSAAAIVV